MRDSRASCQMCLLALNQSQPHEPRSLVLRGGWVAWWFARGRTSGSNPGPPFMSLVPAFSLSPLLFSPTRISPPSGKTSESAKPHTLREHQYTVHQTSARKLPIIANLHISQLPPFFQPPSSVLRQRRPGAVSPSRGRQKTERDSLFGDPMLSQLPLAYISTITTKRQKWRQIPQTTNVAISGGGGGGDTASVASTGDGGPFSLPLSSRFSYYRPLQLRRSLVTV